MNSTWLITSELANQRARKVLFTCVVYTNDSNNKNGLLSKYPYNKLALKFTVAHLTEGLFVHCCQIELEFRSVGFFGGKKTWEKTSESHENSRNRYISPCNNDKIISYLRVNVFKQFQVEFVQWAPHLCSSKKNDNNTTAKQESMKLFLNRTQFSRSCYNT